VQQKAIKLLRSRNFFGEIRKPLSWQGLVGPFSTAILTYNAAVSASLNSPLDPSPHDPLNVILAGPTSADTNFFANQVLRLVPPEAICEITSTAEDARASRNDSCKGKILFLHDDRRGRAPAQFVLSRKGLLAQTVEADKRVTHIVAQGPFATIATSAANLQIGTEVPYISAWVGSPTQDRPALKQPVLSDWDLGIWHEAYRLLAERCHWLFFNSSWVDSISDLVPRNSVAGCNLRILTGIMKMSAIIRSFRNRFIGGNPIWQSFLSVDFQDYCIAAAILNGVLADDHHREQCDGEGRPAVTTKSRVPTAGGIARANRAAMNGDKLVQAVPLRSKLFPSPEGLIETKSWAHPIEFVHPLTGELVTVSPRKKRSA